MKKTILSEEQQKEIASSVIKIRKNILDDEKFDIDEDTIRDILMPQRDEDNGDDLWSVFNRCQERMIKGGYSSLNSQNKARKQRGITSIKRDVDCNQKLWAIAERYMPATVAA
jgi:hypothetical protein